MSESIPPTNVKKFTIADQMDYCLIRIDRLQASGRLIRWAACTAIVAALGAAGGMCRMLYGMGSDDQITRNGIERAQRECESTKSDVRELQKIIFPRRQFVLPPMVKEEP